MIVTMKLKRGMHTQTHAIQALASDLRRCPMEMDLLADLSGLFL